VGIFCIDLREGDKMKINRRNLHEKVILYFFIFCSVIYLLGNIDVPEGDMVRNSNLDKNNFYLKSAQKVKELRIEGFIGADRVGLIIPLSEGVNKKELKFLLSLHEDLKQAFPRYGLYSLVNAYRYSEEGELGIAQVSLEELESPNFDLEKWKNEVRRDSYSFGFLVGKKFDSFQIVLQLILNYDEVNLRNRLATLLEKRKISKWKWIVFKNDIEPIDQFERILFRGWGIARAILTAILKTNVLWFSVLALICSFPFSYALNGSLKQTSYVYLIIFLGLIFVRGSIGILYWFGFELFGEPLKETVYIILVDAGIIINGVSFPFRKLDSYNYYRKIYPDLDSKEVWKFTKRFDGKIYIVAVISIFGFATMYTAQNRGLIGMGILSSLGVVYLVAMTKWLLPAKQILWGGEVSRDSNWLIRLGDIFLLRVTKGLFWLMTRFSESVNFWIAIIILVVSIGGASYIVVHDYWIYSHSSSSKIPFINLGTDPGSYLLGSSQEKSSDFCNQPGGFGFGNMSFLIKGDIYDPKFIKAFYSAQKEVEKIKGVMGTKSVVDAISYVSRIKYQVNLPENREELETIFFLIESNLDYLIISNGWFENGIVLDVFVPAKNSNNMERQAEETIKIFSPNLYQKMLVEKLNLSDWEIDSLVCLPYGRFHEYHQSDKNIQRKQSLNLVLSYWMIMLFSWLWLIYRGWTFKKTIKQKYRLINPLAGLAMGLPFAFSCSCIVYLMAWTGIPLDQSMGCVAPLSISAATDFNLHFMDDFNDSLMEGSSFREALYVALVERGGINIMDIANNAYIFAFLIQSPIYPIKLIGIMLVLMMFTCGFGALVLMPVLLSKCIKRLSPGK